MSVPSKKESYVERAKRINVLRREAYVKSRDAELRKGPTCRKCEIEKDLGYCRCERAANH